LGGSSPTVGATGTLEAGHAEDRHPILLGRLWALFLLGFASAGLHACARLRLGIPGHSAVLWLTPLLLARSLAPAAGATTIAATVSSVTRFAVGGFSLRWPAALSFVTYWAVGPAIDYYVSLVERLDEAAGRGDRDGRFGLPSMLLAGIVGNYAHLAAKVGLGVIRSHVPYPGLDPGWYELTTYFFFGAIAGAMACCLRRPFISRRGRRARAAFTLIELLAVIAIAALVTGMLLPALHSARERARRTTCVGALSEMGKGLEIYCSDYGGYFPGWHGYGSRAEDVRYYDRLGKSRVPDVADAERSGIHDLRALGTSRQEKSGPYRWMPGDLARCPIHLGLLMVTGTVPDGTLFRCPSAGMDGRDAIWKRIGGSDARALLYGYDSARNRQQPHVKGSYNYRNAALDILGDAPVLLPFVRPEHIAFPNEPAFKTQKALAARAVVCDSFDRPFAEGPPERNPHPGRGESQHKDGYNVLYGDGRVTWYADPDKRIAWYSPRWRSAGGGEPDPCHDWIDRSNLGSQEVWHMFDAEAGIDLP